MFRFFYGFIYFNLSFLFVFSFYLKEGHAQSTLDTAEKGLDLGFLPEENKKNLQQSIFNEELSREFEDNYRQKFGLPGYGVYNNQQASSFSISAYDSRIFSRFDEQYYEEKKIFGEYVLKRLSEWHLDNYFKSDPSTKKIYIVKQALTQQEWRLSKQAKLKYNYSLTGNWINTEFVSPWFETSLNVQMNTIRPGPQEIVENKVSIGKKINFYYHINANVAQYDGVAQVSLLKQWPKQWTSYMGYSSFYKPVGLSPREYLYTFGINRPY